MNEWNDSCRASYNCGGQVASVLRLPAGQVEFSGLFLILGMVGRIYVGDHWTLLFYQIYKLWA